MGWFSKSDKDFFLSTTQPDGLQRSQYLGVVHGEAIIGANIFRDMFSSVRDVVGGLLAAMSVRSRAPATTPWRT